MPVQTNTDSQLDEMRKKIELMELQQRFQQLQGEGQGQQTTDGGNGNAATQVHKKHVRIEASSVKGTVLDQASGTLKATLRDVDGEPLADQEIVFLLTSSREEIGRTATDPNGVAQVNAGSNIGDPQLWIQALGRGFTAVFAGTREYFPAEAKTTTRASLF